MAHLQILHQQKELLKKAKSRKGQRPTQDMLRSRAELEEDFFNAVIPSPADANAALLDTNEILVGPPGQNACSCDWDRNEDDFHRRSLPAVG